MGTSSNSAHLLYSAPEGEPDWRAGNDPPLQLQADSGEFASDVIIGRDLCRFDRGIPLAHVDRLANRRHGNHLVATGRTNDRDPVATMVDPLIALPRRVPAPCVREGRAPFSAVLENPLTIFSGVEIFLHAASADTAAFERARIVGMLHDMDEADLHRLAHLAGLAFVFREFIVIDARPSLVGNSFLAPLA